MLEITSNRQAGETDWDCADRLDKEIENKQPANGTVVYHISKGYKSATAWQGDASGQRVCVSKITVDKGTPRSVAYVEICEWLKEKGVIEMPAYKP